MIDMIRLGCNPDDLHVYHNGDVVNDNDDDDDDQLSMLHDNFDTVSKDIARSLCNYDICQDWSPIRL